MPDSCERIRNGLEAKEKRTYIGLATDLQRTYNGLTTYHFTKISISF